MTRAGLATLLAILLVLVHPALSVVTAQAPPGAPPPGASAAPSANLRPAHFSVNTSLSVDVIVSGLGAQAPDEPYRQLTITLPRGAVVTRTPVGPSPHWALTAESKTADPPFFTYTAVAPGVPDEVFVFPITVDRIPCEGGLASHSWSLAAHRAGGPPASFATSQLCDKKPPTLAQPLFEGVAKTGDGVVALSLAQDDSPVLHTAVVTLPDGSQYGVTRNTLNLSAPIPPNAVGAWSYHVLVFDDAGNSARFPASGEAKLTVLDTTPPVVSLSAPGPQEAGIPAYALPVASDNGGTAYVELRRSVNGGPFVTANATGVANFTLPAVADWKHVVALEARAFDPAGNSAWAFANLSFLDRAAPALSSLLLAPGGATALPNGAGWHDGNLTLRLVATDVGSPRVVLNHSHYVRHPDGTLVATHGNGTVGQTEVALNLTGPADHTVHWSAKDDSGNVAAGLHRTVRIDPGVSVGSFENLTSGWRTTPLWVTFRTTTPHSGIDAAGTGWSVNGVAQTQPSLLLASDGVHALAWNTRTRAGLTASGTGSLAMDLTPPALSVTTSPATGGDLYAGPVTFSAAASDPTSDVVSLTYTLDNATTVAHSSPVVVSAEGPHQIVFSARNGAGLVFTRWINFTIDRTAPVLGLTVNGTTSPGPWNATARVQLVVSDPDGITVSCTLDGAPVTLPADVAGDGEHEVRCTGQDAAGNAAAPATLRFAVDAAGPAAPAFRDLGHLRAMSEALTFSDLSAVTHAEGRFVTGSTLRDAVLVREGSAWRVTSHGLPDGRHTLQVRATDAHGRTSAWVQTLSFHLVTIPPYAEVHLPPMPRAGYVAPISITWDFPPHPVPVAMLVSVNGGDEQQVEKPYNVTADGTFALSFRPRDALGNVGAYTNHTLHVQPPPPPPPSSNPPPGDGGSPGTNPNNRVPSIAGVTLALSGVHAIATLGAVSDPDGQEVQVHYRWRVNGTLTTAGGASLRVFPGQRVQVEATPWDGHHFGATVRSAELVVPGERPIPSFTVTGDLSAGAKLTFDASGSRLAVSHRWSFSDGGRAEGARVERSFAAGAAWAELTVASSDGTPATLRKDFTIRETEEGQAFVHVAVDGTTFRIQNLGDPQAEVLRELPGHRFLLRTQTGLFLWSPKTNARDPLTAVEGAPGEASKDDATLTVPVGFTLGPGLSLVRLADPQPGLVIVDVVESGGASATWWRENDGTLRILTRSPGVTLEYATPSRSISYTTREIAPGEWEIFVFVGGGDVESIRVLEGETLLVEEKAEEVTFELKRDAPLTTLRVVARGTDGEEKEWEIELVGPEPTPADDAPPVASTPATPPATTPDVTPAATTPPPGDDGIPGPSALVAALAAALVALALGRRRRG